jgi:hypothetical protein
MVAAITPARDSITSAARSRILARAVGAVAAQPSNAEAAAATARVTSAVDAAANVAITSPVYGFWSSTVRPSAAPISAPSMKSPRALVMSISSGGSVAGRTMADVRTANICSLGNAQDVRWHPGRSQDVRANLGRSRQPPSVVTGQTEPERASCAHG